MNLKSGVNLLEFGDQRAASYSPTGAALEKGALIVHSLVSSPRARDAPAGCCGLSPQPPQQTKLNIAITSPNHDSSCRPMVQDSLNETTIRESPRLP